MLDAKVATLPQQPGVYLFKDGKGRVLYVGKAKDLRARVRQYVSGQDERFMVPYLLRAAKDVDVVVVPSEKDALILENTLIKKHLPRFNTKLVDDASFLSLRIDPKAPWPDYRLVRRVDGGKARTFGPFASASKARATLELVHRHFPLRTCSDEELKRRKRPCLLHQMGRCLAPCAGLCTKEQYDEVVLESMLFLRGQNKELVQRLERRMQAAAEDLRFEEAARLRDLVGSVKATLEAQHVVDHKEVDRDIWGLYREGTQGFAAVVPQRRGLLQEALTFPVDDLVGDDDEVLSSLLNALYGEGDSIPPEVLLPVAPPDMGALAEVLGERRGAPVTLTVPQKGDKRRQAELAHENARQAFLRRHSQDERARMALDELARVARLSEAPRRIECFDNSNIAGSDPVASMVVFTEGRPDRKEYRRYTVKTVVGSDDYATMREILGRRFRRALEDGVFPDLLVVDGGKGQVSAALDVLRELGLEGRQPLIGLAKPRTEHAHGDLDASDKIVLPGVKNLIRLDARSPALQLLQHLRDEAHDTAIRFHRKKRSERTFTSALDHLEGVGPSRRKALLQHFGGLQGVERATKDELAAVPGIGRALAARIHAQMQARR